MIVQKFSRLMCLTLSLGFYNQQASAITQEQVEKIKTLTSWAVGIIAGGIAFYKLETRTPKNNTISTVTSNESKIQLPNPEKTLKTNAIIQTQTTQQSNIIEKDKPKKTPCSQNQIKPPQISIRGKINRVLNNLTLSALVGIMAFSAINIGYSILRKPGPIKIKDEYEFLIQQNANSSFEPVNASKTIVDIIEKSYKTKKPLDDVNLLVKLEEQFPNACKGMIITIEKMQHGLPFGGTFSSSEWFSLMQPFAKCEEK